MARNNHGLNLTTKPLRGPAAKVIRATLDRVVSTTIDMDEANTEATSEWVQFWRLSDLKLLRSIPLNPGPRGDENRFTGEPRLLPDGQSIYNHCGLYLLRGVERPDPVVSFRVGF